MAKGLQDTFVQGTIVYPPLRLQIGGEGYLPFTGHSTASQKNRRTHSIIAFPIEGSAREKLATGRKYLNERLNPTIPWINQMNAGKGRERCLWHAKDGRCANCKAKRFRHDSLGMDDYDICEKGKDYPACDFFKERPIPPKKD